MKRSTRLAAAIAAALLATSAPAVADVPVVTMQNGATQPVTRTVPGFDVTGTYDYVDNGEPMVVLNADGSGTWKGDSGEASRPISWWIAADAAGKPLSKPSPNGQALTLIVDFGGQFSGFEFAIAKEPRQMWINRERFKAY